MIDHPEEFVWSADGEEAEVLIHAPDEETAEKAFDRAYAASKLPGALSPVYVASVPPGEFGCCAASDSHVAPDLTSVPARGILLVSETPVASLGVPREELSREIYRLWAAEFPAFHLNTFGVRRACEFGAWASAEDALIEEDDLGFLPPLPADPDALGRRALSAGERDWTGRVGLCVYGVEEVFDSAAAESFGLEPGAFALEICSEAGELGRISRSVHRERALARVLAGDFDSSEELPAAPLETEEARDFLLAAGAAANFADGRAAQAIYTLRRALSGMVGDLELRGAWRLGGARESESWVTHRRGLAEVGEGEPLVSGGVFAVGAGTMNESAPPFGMFVEDERWLWEEVGGLERWAGLKLVGGEG